MLFKKIFFQMIIVLTLLLTGYHIFIWSHLIILIFIILCMELYCIYGPGKLNWEGCTVSLTPERRLKNTYCAVWIWEVWSFWFRYYCWCIVLCFSSVYLLLFIIFFLFFPQNAWSCCAAAVIVIVFPVWMNGKVSYPNHNTNWDTTYFKLWDSVPWSVS